jgi:hypothetical protein
MAGRPRRTALLQCLERRTREWAETQDDGTYDMLDYAESWIAGGNTLTKLAAEISEDSKLEISRDMLKRVLAEGRKAEADRRLAEARIDGAHGLVEEAISIVDKASDADKDKLTHAKMKAETRLWAAERWNKKELGRAPDVAITINNNTLHLDALRVRQVEQLAVVEQQHTLADGEGMRARSLALTAQSGSLDVIDADMLPSNDEDEVHE